MHALAMIANELLLVSKSKDSDKSLKDVARDSDSVFKRSYTAVGH